MATLTRFWRDGDSPLRGPLRMARYPFLALGALVLLAFLGGCDAFSRRDIEGSGTIVTETRPVGGVDVIRFAGEGTVIVTVGEGPSLTIETDDNLLEYIETWVRNRLLDIRTEDGVKLDPTDSITYRVSMKTRPQLIVTGTGSFEVIDRDTDLFP